MPTTIIRITDRPELLETAARWFLKSGGSRSGNTRRVCGKRWLGLPPSPSGTWPWRGSGLSAAWGVIENDFHNRKDLAPNVCAVYTEPDRRGKGIAGALLRFVCADMAGQGIRTLYLLTDHTGFYERYGWEFYCMVQGDGEEAPSRMYRHRAE